MDSRCSYSYHACHVASTARQARPWTRRGPVARSPSYLLLLFACSFAILLASAPGAFGRPGKRDSFRARVLETNHPRQVPLSLRAPDDTPSLTLPSTPSSLPPDDQSGEDSQKKGKKKKKKPTLPSDPSRPEKPVKPPPGPPTLQSSWARIERWNRFLPESARLQKYCAMAESPFRFMRGSNHLFWEDLSNDKRKYRYGGERMHRAWLQGDLHPENWGTFHDINSRLVYGVNDFDDALMDDYQIDLWRMSTGIILWSQANFPTLLTSLPSIRDSLVWPFVRAYLDRLEVTRDRGGFVDNDEDDITLANAKEPLLSFMEKVNRTRTRSRMIDKYCRFDEEGNQRFDIDRNAAKLQGVTEARGRELRIAYRDTYSRSLEDGGRLWDPNGYFKVKDIAQRIDQGTGSLGQDRYYFLIEGKTDAPDDDRILDVKHQRAPCGLLFWYWDRREEYDEVFNDNHARAYVEGARSMTNGTDIHLGWVVLYDATMFSVSDLSPYKKRIDTTKLDDLDLLSSLAMHWGKGLATTHVRSNGKNLHVSDAIQNRVLDAIGKDKAGFLDLVWTIAVEFYETVLDDYQVFKLMLGDVCKGGDGGSELDEDLEEG